MVKTLITGALKINEKQKAELENKGLDIIFVQNETEKLEIDVSEIEFVICNSLFMYNDIKRFKKLKYIQVTSAGLDRLPIDYINENNIKLFNARGVYSIPIAEWTILKILEIYKHSREFYQKQDKKIWEKNREILELNDKKVAILGFGSIGNEIAKRLKAFNTNITAVDIVEISNEYINECYNISEIKKVLPDKDIIISTLPLTKDTKGFINEEKLMLMKDKSIFINLSRGGIVNEKDLIKILKTEKLLGVALDVFETEPLEAKSELWEQKNIIITPHNSFVSENNNKRMYDVLLNNLKKMK